MLCAIPLVSSADPGPNGLKLSVSSGLFFTDNFYYQPANTEAGYGLLVRPEAVFTRQTRQVDLALFGRGEYGMFDAPGSEDDYLDGITGFRLGATPTLRNRFFVDAAYQLGHDPFGIDRTEDAATTGITLDRWTQVTGSAHYRYGAPGARINAEVGLAKVDKEYTTNETATQPLGYGATTVDYALFYNYSPKTAALIDFSRSHVELDAPFPSAIDDRSGQLYRARVGMRWLATAKTSGDVRVGYRRRAFDNAPETLEALDWSAGVQWSPTPPMTFELDSARSEQQSYRADAQVIDVRSTALTAARSFTSKTKGRLRLQQTRSTFFGSGRVDDSQGIAVNVERRANSRLTWVADLAYDTRDSTVDVREYDRWSGFVGVRFGR